MTTTWKRSGRIIGGFSWLVCGSCAPAAVVWEVVAPSSLVKAAFAYLVGSCVITWFFKWLMVDRPDEVRRNLPISGAEVRRRRKEFYDSLRRS